jgi:hypothetical protein
VRFFLVRGGVSPVLELGLGGASASASGKSPSEGIYWKLCRVYFTVLPLDGTGKLVTCFVAVDRAHSHDGFRWQFGKPRRGQLGKVGKKKLVAYTEFPSPVWKLDGLTFSVRVDLVDRELKGIHVGGIPSLFKFE